MRVFLSFHSKDMALAEVVRAGLLRLAPETRIDFSPVSLGSGFWLPKLAEQIAAADAVLFLIGPQSVGPWQEIEYFEALDRHVNAKKRGKSFPLVPVIAQGAAAPGLPFLRQLNCVEARSVAEDKALHRMLAALNGDSEATATPLWKMVNPYRGLEAMTEANADYFYGRAKETCEVLRALAEKPGRLPVLIGASGVGKSSVAQAGVLAALKAMRWPGGDMSTAATANVALASSEPDWPSALRNSRNWAWLTMRPGDAPFAALTASIMRLWQLDTRDPDNAALSRKWAERLAAGSNKLCDLIHATQDELRKKHGEAPERLLLYVDQGEELYTRTGENDARGFFAMLAEGLADRRLSAFASLRADYFHRLQADEPLFKAHEHINVPPLDRAQLREVVTAPACELRVTFEHAGDADRITTAAAAAPGALPLLSYLLTDMWGGMSGSDAPVMRMPAQATERRDRRRWRAGTARRRVPGAEPGRREIAAAAADAQAYRGAARRRTGAPPDH